MPPLHYEFFSIFFGEKCGDICVFEKKCVTLHSVWRTAEKAGGKDAAVMRYEAGRCGGQNIGK